MRASAEFRAVREEEMLNREQSRTFIRHPVDMPIAVEPDQGQPSLVEMRNLSLGGVAFCSDEAYEPGARVRVRIDCCNPPATVAGVVVWCEPCEAYEEKYEIGVCFKDPADAYRMRMVEQACHIQQYRLDMVIREARYMTLDEAAREWINRYAPYFPQADMDANPGPQKPTDKTNVRSG